MPKKRFSKALEIRIFERDDHLCMICGDDTPFDKGTIDHKLQRKKDGSDDPSNLQWACWRCNNLKGDTYTDDEVRNLLGLPQHTFKVKWFLSGKVMPTPLYGSGNILNSDLYSKIEVNQLGKDKKVNINCELNGLLSITEYRLFLAKSYSLYSKYPGLFSTTVPPISFTTDQKGSAQREFILNISDFPSPGAHLVSIWLNELNPNRTILISDNFNVTI